MDNNLPVVPAVPQNTARDFRTALRDPGPDRFQVATSLLDRGADIKAIYEFPLRYPKGGGPVVPREQITALYDVAKRDDYEAVQFLLSKGADVRTKNLTGMGMHFTPMGFPKTQSTRCVG